MATLYWISTTTQNFATVGAWSTTQTGSSSGTQPAAGDTVIFTNSFSGTCTIAANTPALLSFDCQGGTGPFTGTIAHNAFSIIIGTGGGVFRLSSGMTYTVANTSLVSFTHTSGTCQITSAGKLFGAVTQSGAGGTVQQQDNFACTGAGNAVFTLTAGTWDCNVAGGYTFSATLFNSNNSNTRVFTAAGTIFLGGPNTASNNAVWNTTTNTGFTFNKSSNGITVVSVQAGVAAILVIISNLAGLPAWTFQPNPNACAASFSTSFNLPALTFGDGWTFYAPQAGVTCVCPSWTFNGTASNMCACYSIGSASVVQITCTAGTFTATYTAIGFVALLGSPTVNVTNCVKFGNILGITFTNSLVAPNTLPTAIWQDLLSSSDFTTPGSVGALLAAASNLQYTVPAIGRGTVGSSASTTSIPTSAFTPATSASIANQLVGRVVLFDAATTTVALRGQAAVISASSASATPTLTVSALTVTPASGDTFSVI